MLQSIFQGLSSLFEIVYNASSWDGQHMQTALAAYTMQRIDCNDTGSCTLAAKLGSLWLNTRRNL